MFNSIPTILNLLTNRNIALIYSVTICDKKQRIVHGQGASNIIYSTIVFNFDVFRLGEGKRQNEFAEWHVAWFAEWHNYEESNKWMIQKK